MNKDEARNIFSTKVKNYLPKMLTVLFLYGALGGTPQVYAQTNGTQPNSPVVTPVNTVGNTPSSVRRGRSATGSSGYSAGGNTANTNINSTKTGQRAPGQPIGNGSNTAAPYGSR